MDFEALANWSWREALIAIIALLVLYLLVAFLRIQRLKRAKAVEAEVPPAAVQAAVSAYASVQDPLSLPPLPDEPRAPAVRDFAWNEPPPPVPGQQMIDALVSDVRLLRGEIGVLRAELQDVREDVQTVRNDVQHGLSQAQATQNVSPAYSDAMQMAIQGHDAATISQHCGIARAEAELVVALVRNRNDGS